MRLTVKCDLYLMYEKILEVSLQLNKVRNSHSYWKTGRARVQHMGGHSHNLFFFSFFPSDMHVFSFFFAQ